MGCVNIQCHLQWVQFEKGRMDGLGVGGGGAAEGKFPGKGNQRLSRQLKKKLTHHQVFSRKINYYVLGTAFFFFLCLCKVLYSFLDVRFGGG